MLLWTILLVASEQTDPLSLREERGPCSVPWAHLRTLWGEESPAESADPSCSRHPTSRGLPHTVQVGKVER